MRWLLLVVLLAGCASESRRHSSNNYYYRPATPLPRHYDLFRPQPQIVQPVPPPRTQWHHGEPQQYKPRNEGWRNYSNVYLNRPACNHNKIPITEKRYQAPVYKPVFKGFDYCGNPIYGQVLLTPGGCYEVTIGYICSKCGCRL